MAAPEATLVSIPASNYVEKARWALQLAGVPFHEQKWAPVFAYLSTRPKGGRSVPLLVIPGPTAAVLTDSTDILTYCAKSRPELYPNEEARRLELHYDTELGPHTRRCAYYVVFQNNSAACNVLVSPLGFVQGVFLRLFFPVIKTLLLKALNIDERGAEVSWRKIEKMVAEAEERLGDAPIGTKFMAGDTFSAADISFCSHMALLLLPSEHKYLSPYFSVEMVSDLTFRKRLEKLKTSKVAQFVLWCYAHKRPPMRPCAKL